LSNVNGGGKKRQKNEFQEWVVSKSFISIKKHKNFKKD